MSVTHLRKWDVTAIEIALDLEITRFSAQSSFVFSGPAEPRICLVAGFALTSQLKRIISAVDRAVPERPPARLRIAHSTTRSATTTGALSVQPMPVLLRLQTKLLRAIEPGLAQGDSVASLAAVRELDEVGTNFVRNFISDKVLPTFEPAALTADFESAPVRAVGLTIYRLGHQGKPEHILAHWTYPQDPNRSLPLRGRP
jgi:hypothetical protein